MTTYPSNAAMMGVVLAAVSERVGTTWLEGRLWKGDSGKTRIYLADGKDAGYLYATTAAGGERTIAYSGRSNGAMRLVGELRAALGLPTPK